MVGTTCPNCQHEVMTFGVFVRKADVNKIFLCPGCAAELTRPTNKVLLLIFAGILILLALILSISWQQWHGFVKAILSLLAFAFYYFLVKFIGWKFIGWDRVNSDQEA